MKNLAFHSLLKWKIIILSVSTTLCIHFSLKGWENVRFELGNERVKPCILMILASPGSRMSSPLKSQFLKVLSESVPRNTPRLLVHLGFDRIPFLCAIALMKSHSIGSRKSGISSRQNGASDEKSSQCSRLVNKPWKYSSVTSKCFIRMCGSGVNVSDRLFWGQFNSRYFTNVS